MKFTFLVALSLIVAPYAVPLLLRRTVAELDPSQSSVLARPAVPRPSVVTTSPSSAPPTILPGAPSALPNPLLIPAPSDRPLSPSGGVSPGSRAEHESLAFVLESRSLEPSFPRPTRSLEPSLPSPIEPHAEAVGPSPPIEAPLQQRLQVPHQLPNNHTVVNDVSMRPMATNNDTAQQPQEVPLLPPQLPNNDTTVADVNTTESWVSVQPEYVRVTTSIPSDSNNFDEGMYRSEISTALGVSAKQVRIFSLARDEAGKITLHRCTSCHTPGNHSTSEATAGPGNHPASENHSLPHATLPPSAERLAFEPFPTPHTDTPQPPTSLPSRSEPPPAVEPNRQSIEPSPSRTAPAPLSGLLEVVFLENWSRGGVETAPTEAQEKFPSPRQEEGRREPVKHHRDWTVVADISPSDAQSVGLLKAQLDEKAAGVQLKHFPVSSISVSAARKAVDDEDQVTALRNRIARLELFVLEHRIPGQDAALATKHSKATQPSTLNHLDASLSRLERQADVMQRQLGVEMSPADKQVFGKDISWPQVFPHHLVSEDTTFVVHLPDANGRQAFGGGRVARTREVQPGQNAQQQVQRQFQQVQALNQAALLRLQQAALPPALPAALPHIQLLAQSPGMSISQLILPPAAERVASHGGGYDGGGYGGSPQHGGAQESGYMYGGGYPRSGGGGYAGGHGGYGGGQDVLGPQQSQYWGNGMSAAPRQTHLSEVADQLPVVASFVDDA